MAIRWALGCVNPASWLPLAAGREFTQPRDHLMAHLCASIQDGKCGNASVLFSRGQISWIMSRPEICGFGLSHSPKGVESSTVPLPSHLSLSPPPSTTNNFETPEVHPSLRDSANVMHSWVVWEFGQSPQFLVINRGVPFDIIKWNVY